MVWFICDACGDSLKKPKVQQHCNGCSTGGFTCLDCSRHFDRYTFKAHNTCVTEHDKYAKGATKPGGHAANGFFDAGGGGPAGGGAAAVPADEPIPGAEFLASRPPWKCSCCNVSTTSEETLQGHGAGAKHKRRARAVLASQVQQAAVPEQPAATESAAAAAPEPTAAVPAPASATGDAPSEKKSKKRKTEAQHAAEGEGVESAAGVKKARKEKIKNHAVGESTEQPSTDAAVPAVTSASSSAQKSKKGKGKAKDLHSGDVPEASAPDASASAPDAAASNSVGAKKTKKGKKGGKGREPAWQALAMQHLAGVGGGAKVKSLQEAVLLLAGVSAAEAAVAARASMMEQWERCAELSVKGGKVKLVELP